MAEYIVEYLDEEDICKDCFHKEACDAWVRHGATLYDDYHYSVEGCPFHTHAADVEEVRHGRWIMKPNPWGQDGSHSYDCSICGERTCVLGHKLRYCPNCGAKMMEGKIDVRMR